MIDHKRKFIFIENPKTATSSLKRALMGDEYLKNPSDPRIGTVNHDIPEVIEAKYPTEWRDYTKFVVVRNTWGRARSFFDFYRDIAGSASYQSMSFDQWVAADTPPPDEDHLRAPMWGEGRMDDVLCQIRYVQGVDEIVVLHGFDHETRCIELRAGIERICELLGISVPAVPADENRSNRQAEPIMWRSETIDRLRLKYQEEIRRFGFQMPPSGVGD